jgi:Family of unknown function (DUF6055)
MRSSRRIGVAVLAAALMGCQTAPTPAPTGVAIVQPTAAPSTAVAATTTPSRGSEPVFAPPPPPTTTADKIVAAKNAGTIDDETALAYRIFAIFGDPRLPKGLRGERSEDALALDEAHERFSKLSAAAQTLIRPYLLRPTHPESYWNQEPPVAAGVVPAVARLPRIPTTAFAAPAAPACTNGWLSTQVSPNIPVKIWSSCYSLGDPQAALEEARGDVATLWQPETSIMGMPPGDRNIAGDDWEDTPETGDGLLDIYLLGNASPSGHVRDFDVGNAYAATASTPPFDGAAGSRTVAAYIVIIPGVRGLALESTLAHELFHALQYGHNREGLEDCPITSLGSCPNVPTEFFWMTEASATWAEFYFVPAARAILDGPYDRFQRWRTTDMGLSRVAANNAYSSWMWPLFVQQQAGANAIGNIWRAYEGKAGFRQLQAATDSVVPFAQTFREYAVRGWNELLNPGDPLGHHYFDASLDPAFPRDQPEGGRLLDDITMVADGSGPHTEQLALESLATRYLSFDPAGHSVVFDFTALGPEVDVAAIVRLADGRWERRDLPDTQVQWCLDDPKDAIEAGYLIFADHSQDPGLLTRDWSWDALQAGCGVPVGTLVYSLLDTAPISSLPGGSNAIDASVQVRLKRNENLADPYDAMFLNDGSTYGVHEASKTLLVETVDGCVITSTSTGSPGGALEIDSVVGSTWVDDAGKNRLTLGIDLPVHVETSLDQCVLGTSHASSETTLQYPSCDGIETSTTASTQTFTFDCHFQSTSERSGVTGTIVIDR